MENSISLQNRFSAYVMASLDNKKRSYLSQKWHNMRIEDFQSELNGLGESSFDEQLMKYNLEEMKKIDNWEDIPDMFIYFDNSKLVKALANLNRKEKNVIFARIIGELSFKEIGAMLNLKPKQAEMLYYYVLRKLRKELKNKNEF